MNHIISMKNNLKALCQSGIATVVVLVCCFTPILVITLTFLGLSYFVPFLDFILFPLLAVCLILLFISLNKWKKETKNPAMLTTNYFCNECGLEYFEKEWAIKCENWCKQNKTCNLEIITHSIKNNHE